MYIKRWIPTGATLHGRQTAEFQSPSGGTRSCRHTGNQRTSLKWDEPTNHVTLWYFLLFFFLGGVTRYIIVSAIFECVYLVNEEWMPPYLPWRCQSFCSCRASIPRPPPHRLMFRMPERCRWFPWRGWPMLVVGSPVGVCCIPSHIFIFSKWINIDNRWCCW